VKEGWDARPLGEVCKFTGGGTPSKQNPSFWGGNIPWVSPKDMKSDIVTDSIDHITDAAIDQSAAKRIPQGSILIVVRSGILARTIPTAIAGRELTVNQDIKAIIPDKRVDCHFLAYFFRAIEAQLLDRVTRGATVHKLDMPVIKSLEIPLPPLDEQQRIVAVLDEAFEGLARAREHAEVNLRNARELFEAFLSVSLLAMIESYGEDALDEYCDFRNGFAFKSSKFKSNGMPIVRISNIHEDGMKLERLVYTDPNDYKEDLRKYEVMPGELLIAMSGATTGKLGFNDTSKVFLQNQRVGRFCETSRLRLQFLSFFLSTKIEENLAISAGAAQPNLSTKQIREIKLPVPPIEIQDKFIADLGAQQAKIEKLRAHYRSKLCDFDDLRESILQKAFAGELT
jgi:type I restriction enzyme S subunit